MSTTELSEAVSKLQRLSEQRAERVISLIDDLMELEQLETASDLKAAREALADSSPPVPWQDVKAGLDAKFGLPK